MNLVEANAHLIQQLITAQQPSGGFVTHIATDALLQREPRAVDSSFFLGVLLTSLAHVSDPALDNLKAKAAALLTAQVRFPGSINYWLRQSEASKDHPYPDDADSTFCGFAALTKLNPAFVDGARLADLVTILTAIEAEEGGPYRTWLVADDFDAVWKDVDLVVNANIAYFLSLQGVRLEKLDAWLGARIQAGEYQSPYYPSALPALYFLSRATIPGVTSKLEQDLWQRQNPDGGWGSLLETVLALNALLSLSVDLTRLMPLVDQCLAQLTTDESCPAGAFCIDSITKGTSFYAGSSSLTAALCLEVFAKYEQALNRQLASQADTGSEFLQRVDQRLQVRAAQLQPELQACFHAVSKRILSDRRGQEIPLLPSRFQEALIPAHRVCSDEQLLQLGLANVYGWMAYTIYDDFLDEEGKLSLLPVANVCLRELTKLFLAVLPNHEVWQSCMQDVMDGIDGANTWEVSTTRLTGRPPTWPAVLPNFADLDCLAERSFGHALGPIAVLFAAGFDAASPEQQALRRFFHHYLIGRQLDDDAHDWQTDLARGQVNSVAAKLLALHEQRHGAPITVDEAVQSQMEEAFWREDILEAAKTMLGHVEQAEQALQELTSILPDPAFLMAILRPIRVSAERALQEHQRTKQFLQSYRFDETKQA